jgi:hypothetical protein
MHKNTINTYFPCFLLLYFWAIRSKGGLKPPSKAFLGKKHVGNCFTKQMNENKASKQKIECRLFRGFVLRFFGRFSAWGDQKYVRIYDTYLHYVSFCFLPPLALASFSLFLSAGIRYSTGVSCFYRQWQ